MPISEGVDGAAGNVLDTFGDSGIFFAVGVQRVVVVVEEGVQVPMVLLVQVWKVIVEETVFS